jgi:hypothetical protein
MIAMLPDLKRIDFRAIVAGYDWSCMAARYDAAFADVVTTRGYGDFAAKTHR